MGRKTKEEGLIGTLDGFPGESRIPQSFSGLQEDELISERTGALYTTRPSARNELRKGESPYTSTKDECGTRGECSRGERPPTEPDGAALSVSDQQTRPDGRGQRVSLMGGKTGKASEQTPNPSEKKLKNSVRGTGRKVPFFYRFTQGAKSSNCFSVKVVPRD